MSDYRFLSGTVPVKKWSMPVNHPERIRCPQCDAICNAVVERSRPCWTYLHRCDCGHWIGGDEWMPVADE